MVLNCIKIPGLILVGMMVVPISHVFANLPHHFFQPGNVPDISNTCLIDNASSSCFIAGALDGLAAGREAGEQGQYSLASPNNPTGHSPDFFYGYLIGYNSGFGAKTGDTTHIANKTGTIDATAQNASPDPPSCTIQPFCTTYTQAYLYAYHGGIPWIQGQRDGENFANDLISRCHEENNPVIPGGTHTPSYRAGWLEGYGDANADASNDDGTYGHKCTKYY